MESSADTSGMEQPASSLLELRPSHLETLRVLGRLVDDEGIWPGSRWQLAKERGISEYTLRDHLQRLEQELLILRARRREFGSKGCSGTTFHLTFLGRQALRA